MAKIKTGELRVLQALELQQRAAELRRELNHIHLKSRQSAVEQPHRIRQMRRELARVLTVLGEGQRGAATVKP